MFSILTQSGGVTYAAMNEIPEDCKGNEGATPAQYDASGNYISGPGNGNGTIRISQNGDIIEVDMTANPPFGLPKIACVKTTAELIKWHPAGRPGNGGKTESGVEIDTSGDSYPVEKTSTNSSESVRTINAIESVWMLWGDAPYPIYVPIVTQ